MSRVDLHLHSDASDGAVPAEILIARAALAGLTDVAITEHDNVDSWETVHKTARRCGIHATPGIELSTRFEDLDIHLLGYDFSPGSKIMKDLIQHQGELRHRRFARMLKKLRDMGIKISAADIHTEKTGAPGRVHVAQALVASKVVPTVEVAFERFLRKGKPAYVPYETVSPADAIRLVHAAGGFVSLAHPIFGTKDQKRIEQMIDSGLDAIEVLHPKHSPTLQERLLTLCKQRGLLATGGSDWHGTLDETYDLGEWYLEGNGNNGKKRGPRSSLTQTILAARPVRPQPHRRPSH